MAEDIIFKDSDRCTHEEVFEETIPENEEWLFCEICDFKSKSEIGKAIKDNMNSQQKKCKFCETCGKYFKSNKSLTAHQQKGHGNKEAPRKASFVWSESMLDDFVFK